MQELKSFGGTARSELKSFLPAGCHVVGSNHLVLKILPHAMGAQVRIEMTCLAPATLDEQGVGYYGYAFYDRIQQMAEATRLASALLAMYSRTKSATCCCNQIRIRSAGSCLDDGLARIAENL